MPMKSSANTENVLFAVCALALCCPAAFGAEPAASAPGLGERATLTGDWGGARAWLQERGISLKPRLTQFYQGLASGDGDHDYEYGGKADLSINSDLGKLLMVDGWSLNVHAEYNYGESASGSGGALLPGNTALLFPGIDGADAFDISSFFVAGKVGDSSVLMLGKINMVDIAASKPFMGGAGIDSFQNIAFVAPPSGILPPYILGGVLSIRTKPASYTLMLYDPVSVVNRSGLAHPFDDGVTLRAGVEFPVTIGGRSGHQGFSAAYSTQDGTDLASVGDIVFPPSGGGLVAVKDNRYHLAWSFDHYLHQSAENPKAGFGLFGQVGISDGNPNPLDWNVMFGLGGSSPISGRVRDNWGVGVFHHSFSKELKQSVAPVVALSDEQGAEAFYNATLTPWLTVAADLQFIDPAQSQRGTAVVFGLRTSIKF